MGHMRNREIKMKHQACISYLWCFPVAWNSALSRLDLFLIRNGEYSMGVGNWEKL